MQAPLELVIDNFNDMEHTAIAHWQFGYALEEMSQAVLVTESTKECVHVVNSGRQRTLSRPSRWLLGIRPGDDFHMDIRTYFAPLYTFYDYWWTNSQGAERPCRMRALAFFVEVSDAETLVAFFFYWSGRSRYRLLRAVLRPFLALAVRHEVAIDQWLIEHVLDRDLRMGNRRPDRFDKPIYEQRNRLRQLRQDEGSIRSPNGELVRTQGQEAS
jgi:vanillate O-demethylase monooxygenase subunit